MTFLKNKKMDLNFSEKLYELLGSGVSSRYNFNGFLDDDEPGDNFSEFMERVKIGSDPELFIINTKTGSVVSSIGLIPGVKGAPWVDKSWVKG